MAEEVAKVAADFQVHLTGHAPREVTVVLSGDTLVITLYGALTAAEQAMAAEPEGAAKVQEFHRQLFATAAGPLRAEIHRITGVAVKEAAVEVTPGTGAVIHAFTTGTMVQVFHLAEKLKDDSRTAVDPTRNAPPAPVIPPIAGEN